MGSKLEDVILGPDHDEPEPNPHGTVVEGRVKSVGPAGLKFTVPDWDDGKYVFGPAPWPMSRVQPAPQDYADGTHDHAETEPASGDRCLVIFVGEGVGNPWVVQTWPK